MEWLKKSDGGFFSSISIGGWWRRVDIAAQTAWCDDGPYIEILTSAMGAGLAGGYLYESGEYEEGQILDSVPFESVDAAKHAARIWMIAELRPFYEKYLELSGEEF